MPGPTRHRSQGPRGRPQHDRRKPPESLGFDEKLAACPRARAIYNAVRDSRWSDDLPDRHLAEIVDDHAQRGAFVQLRFNFGPDDREERIRAAVRDYMGRAKR